MKTAGAFGGLIRQALILVSGPINNVAFTVGQLAVFQGATTPATRKKSQLITAWRVAMKIGRRLSRARGIGHASIQICSASRALRLPILIATKAMLVTGQDTRSVFDGALVEE
jgi:hypothetical protein